MERSNHRTWLYIRWFLIRLSMVIYDIFVVNIAYCAALLIRFYVASEFNVWAVKYISAYVQFAPLYTVSCFVVFLFFKLYNNRWKYAGLNDLNRILTACFVTCVIQVVGSVVFVMRMPITYYAIGAAIQFALIAISRFSYRFFMVEMQRLRKRRSKTFFNVMVVGVGESSRTVLKYLERDAGNAAHPVCLVDFRGTEFGSMQEGLPIVSGVDKIDAALKRYKVESVILADNTMPQSIRKQIRQICEESGIGIQDFSSFFMDFRGAVSLRNLIEYTKGPVELVINGRRQIFPDGEQAFMSLNGKYVVSLLSAKDSRLVIELQNDILVPNDVKEEWVQNYKEETGEDISFF